jgi:sugar O-acyltransferase (sialic acid O-acetyltransferase NeuD family)
MDERIVIIGAGGHAKVVLDAIQQINRKEQLFTIAGLVDDVTGKTELCGYRVEPEAGRFSADCFVVAIGDNQARRDKFNQLLSLNYRPVTIIHPAAVLSPQVKIGLGSVVMAGVVINIDTTIGANCIVNTSASIDHDCTIGDHVHIAPGSVLAGNVSVGEGAFLGAGTKVIPRIALGAWTIAGAGAVVIKDVPADVKVVGVPAKPIQSGFRSGLPE